MQHSYTLFHENFFHNLLSVKVWSGRRFPFLNSPCSSPTRGSLFLLARSVPIQPIHLAFYARKTYSTEILVIFLSTVNTVPQSDHVAHEYFSTLPYTLSRSLLEQPHIQKHHQAVRNSLSIVSGHNFRGFFH